MFPPIAPFDSGLLRVDADAEIYWEASGNPKGIPALYLHGGPGGGMAGGYRRRFDPERFFIVGFEQRGCGRSRPLVTDDLASLASNTTATLIADIEKLRFHLAAERWLLLGVSWGVTLALAYAEEHPERVSGLVMMAIGTTTKEEVAWTTEVVGRLFPEEWDAFERASGRAPGERLVDAYYRHLTDRDPEVRANAARAWCAWEDVHVSLDPRHRPDPSYDDPAYREMFATLVVHYWKHGAFLDEGAILARVSRIAHLPATLIHGRLDVSSPLATAWALHRAWPGSELRVVDDEGHGGPKMAEEQVAAIARMSASW